MVRPTRRAAGLIGGAIVLFLIGTNVQSGWLFALGAMLVGATLVGMILPPLMVRGLEIERRAPADAHAGDDVAVDLVVTNPTRRSRLSLSLRDRHISPFTAFVPSLSPGETVLVGTLRRAARRGVVDGEPLLVGSAAPFGAGRAVRKVPAPGRTVVFPRVVPLSWMPELASASKPLQASSVQARKGTGHDFIGIREYRPGDALRHVHWPTTARAGSLMVREFEQELPRRTGVVIDSSGDRGSDESLLDVACSAAGSIALHALGAGHPVSIVSGSDSRPRAVTEADSVEALTFLAELRAPGAMTGPQLLEAAAAPLGRLDTVVAVLGTWTHNDPDEILRSLAGYEGMQIIAVLVEADSFDGKPTGAVPMSPLGSDGLATALAAAEATVFRVRSGDDLAAALEQPWAV